MVHSSSVCYLPVRFGQLLRCAHKRIVNIMKVYIEKEQNASGINTIPKKCRLYSRLRIE